MTLNPSTCKPSDTEIVRQAELLLSQWGATEIKRRMTRRHIDVTATYRGGKITARVPVMTIHRKNPNIAFRFLNGTEAELLK